MSDPVPLARTGKGKGGKGGKGEKGGKGKRRSPGTRADTDECWRAKRDLEAPDAQDRGDRGQDSRKGRGRGAKGKKGAKEADGEDLKPKDRPELSRLKTPEYTSVTERLADQLARGSYDCMICLNKVKPSHAIWPCDQCWAVFHLKCIKSWIHRCNSAGGLEFSWACPGCRYHRVDRMPEYFCYCKKLSEPELNPHWLAHSCGEVCEKDRGCPHPCPELCHPGPCPRCTAVGGPGSCHCGRERTETTRCGDSKTWSCGATCGRTLSCGQHTCKARCHEGPCPPCSELSEETCYCGNSKELRLCGQEEFSCHKTCNKLLECQEHRCERECHPGGCGLCLRDPERWGDRCACGKTYSCSQESSRPRLVRYVGLRKRCSDRLALCKQYCGKRHERCSHECEKKCHEGSCGQCEAKVQRDCRCGRTHREVACAEVGDVTCHHVCRTKKTCGNHKCDVVCCEGFNDRSHEVHMCLQVCGRPLACGNHMCEEFCHLGNCPPCRVVQHEPIFCACGKQSIHPPVACGTAPPYCDEPCEQLMECGHVCPARCHQGPHPLCYEPVDRLCLGGHTLLKNKPCHVGQISCGQVCGKQLACGHKCSSQCHAGECKPCTQPCGARRVNCSHTCQAPCHPGVECEDTPCRWRVKQACPCGQRVEERSCGAFSGLRRPQFPALRCLQSCDRPPPLEGQSRETVKYTADLFQLATQHRRYVQMLEDTFAACLQKGAGQSLPPCDTTRRLLALEYARLHWRLKTSTKADTAEGWWLVQVMPGTTSRWPRPLLSEIAGANMSAMSEHLLPALSSQPCLRFSGLKTLDEVYDHCTEGLLAVRRGDNDTEAVAFMASSAAGAQLFRRLCGCEPNSWAPLKGAWGQPSRLRVKLEQTLVTSSAPRTRPKLQMDAWESKEDVPEDWEDM